MTESLKEQSQDIISAIELKSLHDLKTNKYFPLTFFIISDDKLMHIKSTNTGGESERDLIGYFVRHAIRRFDADAAAMVSESWVGSLKHYLEKGYTSKDEASRDLENYRQKHGSIEGHPLAVDSLVISFQTPNYSLLRVYEFFPSEKGVPSNFSLAFEDEEKGDEDNEASGHGGRYSHLFMQDAESNEFIDHLLNSGDPTKARLPENFCKHIEEGAESVSDIVKKYKDSVSKMFS